ncbi:MAG: glycosyltransferase [Paludibacteraceae bacterium]|nr:glycosyltransferase [Paludibacteraceae bacterium]MBR2166697.1 glycosyltransferase [Paludibacteraceae bacterium]MBR4704556.1 glycosyltransferase [Paludibacteraceae bacterium]
MLNISIVLYHPKWEEEVLPLLEELLRVQNLRKIYLLDNSEQREIHPKSEIKHPKLRYIHMKANLGYGCAHNIALRESAYYKTELHLVMNSDIRVKAEDIDAMHDWMMANPQVGQMMPRVVSTDGSQQYLAKRLPSPMDVFGRRFLPEWMIARRNRRYELRDMDLTRPINAPYLSGCFMLLRTKAAVEAGLFDERYFMYPEDMDLTRTIHRNWLTLYYPEWTIVHAHTRASYKNKHMLRIHIQNICRYFNKWGWFFDLERHKMNKML